MPFVAKPQKAEQITIPMPRQFRDELVARKDRRFAFGVSLYVVLMLFFGFVLHWGLFLDASATLFLIVDLIAWQFQRSKPWNYVLDKEHMTVIWFQYGEKFWNWFEIYWKRVNVIGVEQAEWRGLPALRVLLYMKNRKQRPDWLLVYAYEDADLIRNQVVPLIEQYRHQVL